MRLIHVVAAVGIPVVALLGRLGWRRDRRRWLCTMRRRRHEAPAAGVSADVWFPSVHVIDHDIISGVPAAEVVQRLENMGVKPEDAVRRVQCYLVNSPH